MMTSPCPGWSKLCSTDTGSDRWWLMNTAKQVPAWIPAQSSPLSLHSYLKSYISYPSSHVLFLNFILANVMNSMLQELDNNLISKDNLIHEQNGKLVEKDKIIQSNTSEIECLKKGTKMQEYKVMDKIFQIFSLLVCRCICPFLKCPTLFNSRSTSCRKWLKSMRMISVHLNRSWRPKSRGYRGKCLTRDVWRSTCTVWSETPSSSVRKNVWVTAL